MEQQKWVAETNNMSKKITALHLRQLYLNCLKSYARIEYLKFRVLKASSDICILSWGTRFAENNYPNVLLYAAALDESAREVSFKEMLWRVLGSRAVPHENLWLCFLND